MPYELALMDDAEWSLGLDPSTPSSVLDAIDARTYGYALVVLTPQWFHPDDVDPFDVACFVGVLLRQTDDRLNLTGRGLEVLLGYEGDGGDMYVGSAGTTSSLDLEAQLDARVFPFANGLTKGSINSDSTTRTMAMKRGTTRRQWLDTICAAYSDDWEWRINPDGTIDVDYPDNIFDGYTTPTLMLTNQGGRGGTAIGKYLTLDGSGDYASASDTGVLDITGDLDIRAKVRATDYTAAAVQTLIAKWNDLSGSQRAYRLAINTSGEIVFGWSANGASGLSATSSGASLTDDTDYWIRATIDVNDGSGNRVIKFYKSTDATNDHTKVNWGSAISTTTTAGTTSIYASTSDATIGRIISTAPHELAGRVYAAAILDGIDGTVVANPNFTTWTQGDSSDADSAGRTWTLAGNAAIVGDTSHAVDGLAADLSIDDIDVSEARSQVQVAWNETAGDQGSASNTLPSGWDGYDGTGIVQRTLIDYSPKVPFREKDKKSVRFNANAYAAWALNNSTQANRLAARHIAKVNTYDQTVTAQLDPQEFHPTRFCKPGDRVYVWDQARGLVDTSNEVYYRGEVTHPKILRVQRMTCPFQEGMGAFVYQGGGTLLADITRVVVPEEDTTVIEMGTRGRVSRAKPRPRRINREEFLKRQRQTYRAIQFAQTQS